jgi:CBS domain-containing protein
MKTLAKDIMSKEIVSIEEGATIASALKLLFQHRITGMPVVDRAGRMIGVYSEFDVIRQLGGHLHDRESLKHELYEAPIEFTSDPHCISEDTSLSVIVKNFMDNKYRRLPVVDESGKLAGIITRRDLMRVFYYRATL